MLAKDRSRPDHERLGLVAEQVLDGRSDYRAWEDFVKKNVQMSRTLIYSHDRWGSEAGWVTVDTLRRSVGVALYRRLPLSMHKEDDRHDWPNGSEEPTADHVVKKSQLDGLEPEVPEHVPMSSGAAEKSELLKCKLSSRRV